MRQIIVILSLAIGLLLPCMPASAAITLERFTADDQSRILVLRGEFELSDDEQALLREVAAFRPAFLTFSSGGGNVDAAMRFGRTIRLLSLPTIQLRSFECASACTLAFLGGSSRFAEAGAIGVHRSSFAPTQAISAQDAVSAVQALTAEIMSYMIEMGVDPALLQLALSVDSSDMRYLTTAEMRHYRVTTDGAADGALASTARAPEQPLAPAYAPTTTAPSLPGSTLPTMEIEARRPNRVALYSGLDFLGSDVGFVEAVDASACAAQCLTHGQCRAFTFNLKTRPGRGPNCFLKSDQGQFDGNSAAISGLLLGRSDAEPQTMHFGIIDPNTSLYENVDVPGFDLSRSPHPTATTPFACRIACVNEGRCAAFTFLTKRKHCWLKSGIGQSRALEGAVTGAKTAMTFAPQSVALE